MHKRYGLLRTVIFEDVSKKDVIYVPSFSDSLEELEAYYNQYKKENESFGEKHHFNEVALFDYEKCAYISNNFNDAKYYRRNVRREAK